MFCKGKIEGNMELERYEKSRNEERTHGFSSHLLDCDLVLLRCQLKNTESEPSMKKNILNTEFLAV